MEQEKSLEEQYPSVSLAYDLAKDSYNTAMKRFDEANEGFEKIRTWITTMTFAFLAWKIPNASIGTFNFFFFTGLAIFVFIIFLTIYGKSIGSVEMPSPKKLWDERLHQDEWTFKKDFIFLAIQDSKKNKDCVNKKLNVAIFIFIFFLLESVSFGFWLRLR